MTRLELTRWSVKDVLTGQSRRVSTTAVRDALWGYPEDKALVARIPGNVELTSPVLDANSLYNTVVLRYRTLIPDLRFRLQWRRAAMPGDALTEGVWIALEGPSKDFRARFVRREDTRWSYLDVAADEQHVYALFSGRSTREFGDAAYGANTVHVFSWRGELVRAIVLGEDVYRIALDRDSGVLFGARAMPYPSVVQFGRRVLLPSD